MTGSLAPYSAACRAPLVGAGGRSAAQRGWKRRLPPGLGAEGGRRFLQLQVRVQETESDPRAHRSACLLGPEPASRDTVVSAGWSSHVRSVTGVWEVSPDSGRTGKSTATCRKRLLVPFPGEAERTLQCFPPDSACWDAAGEGCGSFCSLKSLASREALQGRRHRHRDAEGGASSPRAPSPAGQPHPAWGPSAGGRPPRQLVPEPAPRSR